MKRVIFVILLILGLIGCGGEDKTPAQNDKQQAEQVNLGYLLPTDSVELSFVDVMVEKDMVGKELPKDIFKFSKKIDGKVYWKTQNILAFRPLNPFVEGNAYDGMIDLTKEKLKVDIPLKKIPFLFNIKKVLAKRAELNFDLVKKLDFNLRGNIFYNGEKSIDKLKNEIKIYELKDGQKINLEFSLKALEAKYNYEVLVNNIKKANYDKVYVLEIDNGDKILKKSIILSKMGEFKVVSTSLANGKNIIVKLNDLVDKDFDYTGFISVTPNLKFTVIKQKSGLKLVGKFTKGKTYKLAIKKGIKSITGNVMNKNYMGQIKIEDEKPKIEFLSTGVYMPSKINKSIRIKTMNINKLKIELHRVFDENIVFHLQNNRLYGNKTNTINYSELYRTGKEIKIKELKIDNNKNSWAITEFNLSDLLKDGEKGLYTLRVYADAKDSSYDFSGYYYYEKSSYMRSNSDIEKTIILSDIGVIAKELDKELKLYVNNVLTGDKLNNIKISSYSYQNELIEEVNSDVEGVATFKKDINNIFLIKATDGKQTTYLPRDDYSKQSLVNFDTDGTTEADVKYYAYTERGVYRPGDDINLSLIIDKKGGFPDNHPVKLEFYNARSKKVKTLINNSGKDGFYSFNLKTEQNDPTGSWYAKLIIGEKTINHEIKIETIVPYKIKVNVTADKNVYDLKKDNIILDLESKYLFGNPGANLAYRINTYLESYEPKFKEFKNYTFINELSKFSSNKYDEFEGSLNADGKAVITWNPPKVSSAPGLLRARIDAKVFEKGGRPVIENKTIELDYHKRFVGIEKPESIYVKEQANLEIPVVLLDKKGNPIKGNTLSYKVYKYKYYWWWDYDSIHSFKKSFKSDVNTKVVEQGEITTSDKPVNIKYFVEDYGNFYVEVIDKEGGHSTGQFYYGSYWADENKNTREDKLKLVLNKEKFSVGEKALLKFKTPEKGMALVSIEKGNKQLSSYWIKLDKLDSQIEIPVTKEMAPNVYASVTVVQSYDAIKNDKPIKLFGVVPIMVNSTDKKLDFEVIHKEELKPESSFEVKIKNKSGKRMQYTIAVVDEGLLDITKFKTPNPFEFFNQKEALLVNSYDSYANLMGKNIGIIHNLLKIGGGDELASYAKKQNKGAKARRFKPVSIFKGPFYTDEDGEAVVKLNMPNYIGAVRIMVIAKEGEKTGSYEKSVKVKTDLMMVPTLPRKLSAGDKFYLPVTIFSMKENVGKVTLELKLDETLVSKDIKKTFHFKEAEEKDSEFFIEVPNRIGMAKLSLVATYKNGKIVKDYEIDILPNNPYIYESKKYEIDGSKTITLNENGLLNSNQTTFVISNKPVYKLNKRLKYLIRYPYGCIEQTTSAVFPQLYLKDLMGITNKDKIEIDKNINAAIARFSKFKLNNGAFSYWPYGSYVSDWGTSYAGHFLIEAKNKGYHVPEDLYNNWINYQKSKSRKATDKNLQNIYRLYLLALAGEPEISALNLMRELHLNKMNNVEKWLLAGAYKLVGEEKEAVTILNLAKLDVNNYIEQSGTYGSSLRDRSMILAIGSMFKDRDLVALHNDVVAKLETDEWYSTQTTAYALLGLANYSKSFTNEDIDIVITEGDNKISTKTINGKYKYITNSDSGDVKIKVSKKAFVISEWEGVPKNNSIESENKRLGATLTWYTEDGNPVDLDNVKQGTTLWGRITVTKPRGSLQRLALVQNLPSGFEIENIRLLGLKYPSNIGNLRTGREEYLDIRDDKIMWFFNMNYYDDNLDFMFKINAVTKGEFFMPATLVEVMYDNNYKATLKGKNIQIK